MAVPCRQNSHSPSVVIAAAAAFFTFLFFSFFTTTTLAHLGSSQGKEHLMNQKRLAGPGSWPPTCRSKCGGCGPCKPVHVPVHPGVSFTLEYYPEAWRCKCGNKLFMP